MTVDELKKLKVLENTTLHASKSFKIKTDMKCDICNSDLYLARGYENKFFTDILICEKCNECNILGTYVAINDYFLMKG